MHATTVASNTVLEGRGARTALITTEGFRDVLEMRRLRIPVMYDLQYDKPPPLVPRRRRYEIAERAGPRGDVWRELDPASVAAVAEAVKRDGVDSAAIALLHSYANPEHEHRAAELVRGRPRRRGLRHLLGRHLAGDPRVRADEHGRRQRLRGAGGDATTSAR